MPKIVVIKTPTARMKQFVQAHFKPLIKHMSNKRIVFDSSGKTTVNESRLPDGDQSMLVGEPDGHHGIPGKEISNCS